jgi:predicted transcriptional regulator
MNISLKPELQRRVAEIVESGEYPSPEAFVEQAVEAYLEVEWDRAAVRESIQQLDRGEGISLEDFECQMRGKHGVSC